MLLLLLLSNDVESNPGPHDCNEISIFHLNARSVRNKLSDIEALADEYEVVCITESHLDENVDNSDLLLEGFSEPIRLDRNCFGGGVMIYVADNLHFKRRLDLEFQGGEVLWVELNVKNCSYLICNVYRPEGSNTPFWNSFQNSIDSAFNSCSNIIILGDINVDLLTVINHRLNDIMLTFNLKNVIREATRITNISSTLLDPILVSDTVNVLESSVISVENQIIDHSATVVVVRAPEKMNKTYKRDVWIYKHADYDSMNNLIKNFQWKDSLCNKPVDEACNLFTLKFLEFAETCIPKKQITVRKNDKPWFNSELRKQIRIRDRLHNIARKHKRLNDIRKYKNQRNKVNNMKKFAKDSFYENINGIIDTLHKNDSKSYWQLMRRLMGKSGKSDEIPSIIDSENAELVYTNKEKSNLLNKYFCSISNINDENLECPAFPCRCEKELNDIVISRNDVLDILKILKLNKASGNDNISHNMLKNTAETVCEPLQILFNLSLNQCVFPLSWKTAIVIPLHKKNERFLPSNYRPISLLSCVSKVFERVVHKYLHNFFIENKLLYKYQSGFVAGHSTVYQLIEIYHNICMSLENKLQTCMVFFDISKAFDRVWHKGLLTKLHAYGIKGKFFHWIKHYLSNRTQKVVLGDSSSQLHVGYLTAGVPQGSVVGPFYF